MSLISAAVGVITHVSLKDGLFSLHITSKRLITQRHTVFDFCHESVLVAESGSGFVVVEIKIA